MYSCLCASLVMVMGNGQNYLVLIEFYWFYKMKNWSWIVRRDVSSYEKSLCFVEIWMGGGKLTIWKKGKARRSEGSCVLREVFRERWPSVCTTPGSLLWVVITHQIVRTWLPASCFALIITYVFSRYITYNRRSKYWSNYVLEIKDFIKLMFVWGTQFLFNDDPTPQFDFLLQTLKHSSRWIRHASLSSVGLQKHV